MIPMTGTGHGLDPWVLADLARYGRGRGSEALEHLVAAFSAETGISTARLTSAASDGDLTRVAGEAHRLRGASLGMAATAMAGCCARIEEAARSGDTAALTGSIQQLQQCAPRDLAALQRVLLGRGSANRTEAQT